MISCFKTDIVQYGSKNLDPATFASGQQLPTKPKDLTYFCNPAGLGRKGCKFLSKYDGTIWADKENYYSDFSDIQFLNIAYFISFFDINNDVSYCKGWRPGENNYDGIKWNIKIKKNEWDEFWFDYEYYGTSQEIEYTITYKYEVIDGLLHFFKYRRSRIYFPSIRQNLLKRFN